MEVFVFPAVLNLRVGPSRPSNPAGRTLGPCRECNTPRRISGWTPDELFHQSRWFFSPVEKNNWILLICILKTWKVSYYCLNLSFLIFKRTCESSLTCFHSAVRVNPTLLIFGWNLPQPPCFTWSMGMEPPPSWDAISISSPPSQIFLPEQK